MERGAEEETITDPQKTYVVVIRARSSARFMPGEGFEVYFGDVPGSAGPVRFGYGLAGSMKVMRLRSHANFGSRGAVRHRHT